MGKRNKGWEAVKSEGYANLKNTGLIRIGKKIIGGGGGKT